MPEENEILTQLKALGDELRSRLNGLDQRLQALEESATPAPPLDFVTSNGSSNGSIESEPSAPLRTVGVTITPLHDVSRVRVVEAAFDEIEGVESASLQTLSGDAAHLEVKAREDVPLISGLRRTLRLAFDVSESEGSSFTIALAQPGAEREGGVAAHDA
jgi:hypothetical protein